MAKAEYRSAIRSRKLINTALADLLQEKPLDKITVTDIVTRAELNRGTFYAHYTDVQDVVNRLIEQTMSEILYVISDTPKNITEMPLAILKQVQSILESDLSFYKKVMISNASSFMQEQLISIILDYFLQHEAEFDVADHEQFVLTINFCAGGLTHLYREWFMGNSNLTLDELTTHASNMILGMLSAGLLQE
jgi:AcrR family transcriptional regulator